jgi:hypothetical protein
MPDDDDEPPKYCSACGRRLAPPDDEDDRDASAAAASWPDRDILAAIETMQHGGLDDLGGLVRAIRAGTDYSTWLTTYSRRVKASKRDIATARN